MSAKNFDKLSPSEIKALHLRAVRRANARRAALRADLDAEMRRQDKVGKATKAYDRTLRGPVSRVEMEGWS